MEDIGTVVTGGLVARAVEPGAGDASERTDGACLNCGTSLSGEFCHRCGQKAHVHRTLTAWWHDLVHGVLHLDGKIWRTLPLLVWRPGQLTRRYIQGERARFVSPMALFLFSVLLMFATFSIVGGPFDMGMNPDEFRNSRADMEAALKSERKDLGELQRARQAAQASNDAQDLAEAEAGIRQSQQAIQALETLTKADVGSNGNFVGGVTTGWAWLDDGFKKLNANPGLALYKVQNNAYKFSWMLIPLSVPFVWLLFPFRRGVRMYDHTIFVTYSLAFMTLLMVLLSLLRVAGVSDGWIGSLFAFVPLIHMYRQLKGAYGLRWWSAAARTFLLFICASIVIGLFFTLLLLIGAVG